VLSQRPDGRGEMAGRDAAVGSRAAVHLHGLWQTRLYHSIGRRASQDGHRLMGVASNRGVRRWRVPGLENLCLEPHIRRMTARDHFKAYLKCPRCGLTGVANLAELDEPSQTTMVEQLPRGF
jgi:hypothetical protein